MRVIEFKEVEKSSQDGSQVVKALRETTMSIDRGEFVATIGPPGPGESTSLIPAGRLQILSSGSVSINDQGFSNQKESGRIKLRSKEIGLTLQASNLIPFLTVRKQLLLVDKIKHEYRQKGAKESLEQFGVDKPINKHPEELSGEERQRVAIVYALYNDPSIVLADELAANLDSEKAQEVTDILVKEPKDKNRVTVMITHDTRPTDKRDRIFVMEDGILKEKK